MRTTPVLVCMKRLLLLLALAIMATVALRSQASAETFLLPKRFGGWDKVLPSKTSQQPDLADPVNGVVLKEYGFKDFESATYTRPGRQMTVKAIQFADASGAYGAFTFYKQPQMLNERIGDQGASFNERVLFYRGNVLVEAVLDRVTAMSAAELREFASALPQPQGNAKNLPSLPMYLPRQSYVRNSAKYVVGPAGLEKIDAPLPASVVDFSRGAEVVTGKYSTSQGTATLMLISYPTPQIAGGRLRAIEAFVQNPAAGGSTPVAGTFTSKRSGPIVALAAGQISSAEAKSLLASVNYDADVTWNENTYLDKKNNVANLLVNVIFLIFIILGLALIAGIAFGGVRVLLRRFVPGKVFDRDEKTEIIQLKLGKRAREDVNR